MTGQHLVLLLWTLWLVVALVSVGGRAGLVLLVVVGGLGLGLVLTGLVGWRAYLIAALAVHVLAAASRAFAQLTAVQPGAPARGRPPLAITATVQPGPHAPAAGPRHRSLPVLPAAVQRWPLQVLAGSVSLAGVIWLLILRPAVPWLYRADIPIMIGTVALLVAAEYGCWRFYKHLDRRLAEMMKQLKDERQQRRDNDTRAYERSEWLEKRLQLAEADLSQRRGELSQAQADFRRAQDGLRHTQDRLGHAQEELRHMQAELREAQDELRRSHGDLHQAHSELRQAHSELPQAQDESQPPQGNQDDEDDEGDAPVWYRAAVGVGTRAEPDQMAGLSPVRVELIRIVRLSPEGPGRQPGRSGIAIERGTLTITPEPGETVRHLTRRGEERLGREIEAATAQYTAQTAGDRVWKTVSQHWTADGLAGFDAVARTVADFDADLHNILLNRPVQQLSSWAGLPGPASAVLGGAAGAAGLPGDRPLEAVTRVIQFGGIVVGMASGHAVLASACFKSFVHDKLIEGLARGIETTLTKRAVPREPAAGRAAAGPADRLAADRTTTERGAEPRPPADRAATDRAATDRAATDRAATDRSATDRATADRAAALRRAAADRAAAARRAAADSAAAEERAAAERAKRAAEEPPATRPNRDPRGPGFSPFG